MHEGEGYRPEAGMTNLQGLPSLEFRRKVRAIISAIRQMLCIIAYIPSIKKPMGGPSKQ
jgi:hypothetical protein